MIRLFLIYGTVFCFMQTFINFLKNAGGNRMGNEAITILSYDLLTKFNLHRKFHCAIADESHFIKNGKY